MKKSFSARKIVSVFVGLMLGVCVSGAIGVFIPSLMSLSSMSVFSSTIMAVLYGFGGLVPALTMALSMILSGFILGDWVIAAYLFLIGILPGAIMIHGSKKGFRFFAQLRNAMIAELAAFVILLAALRFISGLDFSEFFKTIWDQMIDSLPLEARNAFAELLNELINQANADAGVITTEDMLTIFSDTMVQTLTIMMPIALMLYSVINASAGVLWMNWLRRRHNEENVQFVPLRGWRLSKQVTLGLLIVLIAVMIIGNEMGGTGVSAKIMVISAVFIAAVIQASASFLSRLHMMGVTSGKRILFLCLFAVMSFTFFPIYGILSALFGSKGLFTPKMHPQHTQSGNTTQQNKKPETENDSEHDNDEEEQ